MEERRNEVLIDCLLINTYLVGILLALKIEINTVPALKHFSLLGRKESKIQLVMT